MFETKRSRGWFLAGLVAAFLVVGGVVGTLSARAYEDERDDFVEAANDQLADVSTREAVELWDDEIVGTWTGVSSELSELLVVDGHEPERVSSTGRRRVEAVYRIDAWGRHGTIVVRWSPNGFEIHTD